ncbi:MAG: ABC transporter permease [Terriglobales bacterium]
MLRAWRRSPLAALAVVTTLALGIGTSTAAFSLAAAAWLNPLPFPESRQFVNLWLHNPKYPGLYLGLGDPVSTLRRALPALSKIAPYEYGQAVWRLREVQQQMGTALVSPEMFRMLGVKPARGRFFTKGASSDAVVSASLGIELGAVISCNGRAFTVIGIAPENLRFPSLGMPGRPVHTDVWLAFTDANDRLLAGSVFAQRSILARRKSAASPVELRTQVAALSPHLSVQDRPNPDWSLITLPLATEVTGAMRAPLLMLFLATLLVWLIAVANAAHLLLERTAARAGEFGVRLALGAGRGAIARAVFADSLLLACGGGAAGLGLAYAAIAAARAWAPAAWLPANVGINPTAAGFGLAAAILAGLLAAWLPVRRALKAEPQAMLRGTVSGLAARTGGARSRAVLLAGELALATILLIASAILVQSFVHLVHIRTGMRSSDVISTMFRPPKELRNTVFDRRLLRRFRAMPGVGAAALASAPLLEDTTFLEPVADTGRRKLRGWQHRGVTPGYFHVLGIRLLRGRAFSESDIEQSGKVLVINESFAKRGWPDTDPVGQAVRIDGAQYRVIGEVTDARDNSLTAAPAPELYSPLFYGSESVALVIRTRANPDANWPVWNRRIRQAVWAMAGDDPLSFLQPLSESVVAAQAGPRFRTGVLTVLAIAGLLLAALGVYGVFSYAAENRRHEVGIRLALGAQPEAIARLFLLAAGRVILAGAALGVLGGWLAARLLRAYLPGVSGGGGAATIAVAALALAALAASYVPARRAAATDPARTLREA